jgi:hypothetical protein
METAKSHHGRPRSVPTRHSRYQEAATEVKKSEEDGANTCGINRET